MKKTKVLADIFFNRNNEKDIYKILSDMRHYNNIVYYDDYYEIQIDSIMLEEYLARYDTYVTSGQLLISHYDYINVYQTAVDVIRYQAEILNNTTYKKYKNMYDGWQLDLPVVKSIKHYECW